jgi:hypothetical protein
VQTVRPLRERSLEELLWQVLAHKLEGLVAIRDRDGLRHGLWLHAGFIVGIHVAGRFDPLLDLLRRDGALDPVAYKSCVEALWRSGMRSGAIAMQVAGVARPLVRDALKAQAAERMRALLAIVETRGHDACFEPGDVPATEMSVRLPLGSLLRAAGSLPKTGPAAFELPEPNNAQPPTRASEAGTSRDQARRRLRELARTLHPDKHTHLDAAARKRLEAEMAAATAAYHGFA